MPVITMTTNVSQKNIPEGFHATITDIGSKHLRKPREVVWVQVDADSRLTLGGTFDPTVIVRVECIGRLKPSVNRNLSKDICDVIKRKLEVPKDRVVIFFSRIPSLFCSYNGTLHDTAVEYDEDLE